jgi:hypothetical protein
MKTTFFLALAVCLTFGKLYSQPTQKLLFCSENGAQDNFVTRNNLQKSYVIYQNFFIPDGSSGFSKELMEKSLDHIIPDKNQSGYAALDWEGAPYNILHGTQKASEQEYNAVLNAFIATIRYAKQLRPNIKWSFYGMPTMPYMQYKEGNDQWAAKLMPLLRNLDFFDPSLYLQNANETLSDTDTKYYAASYLRYSLELAVKMNKPIFPFVWNRFSDNSMISYTKFTGTLKAILSMQYQNQKVNGVIWWNCEPNLFVNRKNSASLMNEYKNVTDPSKHQIDLLQNDLNAINPLFK